MPLFDGELENRPLDPSEEFSKQYNHDFLAQKIGGFDPRSASGTIEGEFVLIDDPLAGEVTFAVTRPR